MGEWSEYFEDFPEENPANYVGDRFDPKGADALRLAEAKLANEHPKGADALRLARAKLAAEQKALDAEIARIVQKHSKSSASNKSRE